ncbi:MAG: antibiotic biosynthesis monooxygenase [Actinomycetia bacterium]|nr:antibiotic biosynthesis monooxygenase [Actinomycetes bacterium]
MFLEIAILDVKPECVERIEQVGREVAEHLERGETKGFRSYRLIRAAEDPNRFVLHLTWDAIEDHVALGESDYGQQVGAILQDSVASEPVVHHYQVVDGCSVGSIEL